MLLLLRNRFCFAGLPPCCGTVGKQRQALEEAPQGAQFDTLKQFATLSVKT